jgi:hypothetical protein
MSCLQRLEAGGKNFEFCLRIQLRQLRTERRLKRAALIRAVCSRDKTLPLVHFQFPVESLNSVRGIQRKRKTFLKGLMKWK